MNVRYSAFVGGLAVDTVGGSEKIAVLEGSTPAHVTPDLLSTFTIDTMIAASALTPTSGDGVLVYRGSTQGTMGLDDIADYAIGRNFSEASAVDPVVGTDELIIQRSGSENTATLTVLASFVTGSILDFSSLTAATPGATDVFAFTVGTDARKITLADLETKLHTDYATYVAGLDAADPVTDGMEFYLLDGGAPKKVTASVLNSYFSLADNVTIAPNTTTQHKIPQWDSTAKTLVDGLTLSTAVRSEAEGANDTTLATELGVRKAIGVVANAYVDASSMKANASNGATFATYVYTNGIELDYFAFDSSTVERVQFKFAMPEDWDRGPMKARFYWTSPTGSTAGDTVEWAIRAVAMGDSDVVDAGFGTAQSRSDTLLSDNGGDIQITGATLDMTPAGSLADLDLIVFEVYRNVSGADTMSEDAWLAAVKLQYNKTRLIEEWT